MVIPTPDEVPWQSNRKTYEDELAEKLSVLVRAAKVFPVWFQFSQEGYSADLAIVVGKRFKEAGWKVMVSPHSIGIYTPDTERGGPFL